MINWIKKFKNDDYSFTDKLRSGCPTKIDKDDLNNSLNENSSQTTRELAEKFKCSKSSIHHHLKKLRKIQNSSAAVPYNLAHTKKRKELQFVKIYCFATNKHMVTTRDFFTKSSLVMKSGANT